MFNGRIVLASNFKLGMNSESWCDSYPIYLSSLQSLRKNPLSAMEVATLPSTHGALCFFSLTNSIGDCLRLHPERQCGIVTKRCTPGTGETVQWLRIFPALSEDLSSDSSIQIRWLTTTCDSSSREFNVRFWPHRRLKP